MRGRAVNHKISNPDLPVWNGWCGTSQEGFVVSLKMLQSPRISQADSDHCQGEAESYLGRVLWCAAQRHQGPQEAKSQSSSPEGEEGCRPCCPTASTWASSSSCSWRSLGKPWEGASQLCLHPPPDQPCEGRRQGGDSAWTWGGSWRTTSTWSTPQLRGPRQQRPLGLGRRLGEGERGWKASERVRWVLLLRLQLSTSIWTREQEPLLWNSWKSLGSHRTGAPISLWMAWISSLSNQSSCHWTSDKWLLKSDLPTSGSLGDSNPPGSTPTVWASWGWLCKTVMSLLAVLPVQLFLFLYFHLRNSEIYSQSLRFEKRLQFFFNTLEIWPIMFLTIYHSWFHLFCFMVFSR